MCILIYGLMRVLVYVFQALNPSKTNVPINPLETNVPVLINPY